MTATTTTYHLTAITDELAAKVHLGAAERGARTWCGVDLLIEGDTRFGGKHKDGTGFTTSADLETVDCGACRRGAAWRIYTATGSGTVGIRSASPASGAASEAAPATGPAEPPPARRRPSAATRAAAKAEQAAADQAAADQAARDAR